MSVQRERNFENYDGKVPNDGRSESRVVIDLVIDGVGRSQLANREDDSDPAALS